MEVATMSETFMGETVREGYAPRWWICARALGITPSELTAGRFLEWMTPRVARYKAEVIDCPVIIDHDAFTAWLDEEANATSSQVVAETEAGRVVIAQSLRIEA